MKNTKDRENEYLKNSISIITRGGPITVNIYQQTTPVLLKRHDSTC